MKGLTLEDLIRMLLRRQPQTAQMPVPGLLSAPAASIGGEEFIKAAEKYKLPKDNDTLNMIIKLVNQGMTPDDAAKALSEGMAAR